MKLIECSNGYLIYQYNNGKAVAIGCLDGSVDHFSTYMDAYMWSLPF
ncbi:MAG: hypothetical protein RR585_07015 [Coprobacillus sp.]